MAIYLWTFIYAFEHYSAALHYSCLNLKYPPRLKLIVIVFPVRCNLTKFHIYMLFFLLDQTSHVAGVTNSNNFVLSANGDFVLMFDSVRVLKCMLLAWEFAILFGEGNVCFRMWEWTRLATRHSHHSHVHVKENKALALTASSQG
jgi:hypothetical protein